MFRHDKPDKKFIIKLWFDKNGILEHVFAWWVTWYSGYAYADADMDEYVMDSALEFISNLLREEEDVEVIEE